MRGSAAAQEIEPLFSTETIAARVDALAREMATHPMDSVMPGLEPAIQGQPARSERPLDCRVKPGNDVVQMARSIRTSG